MTLNRQRRSPVGADAPTEPPRPDRVSVLAWNANARTPKSTPWRSSSSFHWASSPSSRESVSGVDPGLSTRFTKALTTG